MRNAVFEADRLMNEYFDWRHEDNPGPTADLLLKRISLDTTTHKWKFREHAKAADEILQLARFDVDDFAENFLGLTLRIEPLSRFDDEAGSSVFGMASPGKGEIVICERALKYEPLYRTTMMHEIGHVRLHRSPHSRIVAYTPFSTKYPRHEREANAFMKRSLLPMPILKLAVARCADTYASSLEFAIRGANTEKGLWQWREHYLPMLINTLCVSRQLLCITLKKMKIFTEGTVAYHQSYALHTRWKAPNALARINTDRLRTKIASRTMRAQRRTRT